MPLYFMYGLDASLVQSREGGLIGREMCGYEGSALIKEEVKFYHNMKGPTHNTGSERSCVGTGESNGKIFS